MGWEKLKNQPAASKLLQNYLARGRVAHAYLFLGPDSDSKTEAALLLAQAANCATGAPCGTCRSCNLIAAGRHPDVEVLTPQGLSLIHIYHLCRGKRRIRSG